MLGEWSTKDRVLFSILLSAQSPASRSRLLAIGAEPDRCQCGVTCAVCCCPIVVGVFPAEACCACVRVHQLKVDGEGDPPNAGPAHYHDRQPATVAHPDQQSCVRCRSPLSLFSCSPYRSPQCLLPELVSTNFQRCLPTFVVDLS